MSADLLTSQSHGESDAEPEVATAPPGIGGVGILDLTSLRSFDELMAMSRIGGRISGVGTALVPAPLLARFATLPIAGVGTLVPVPLAEAGTPRVRVGEIYMSGYRAYVRFTTSMGMT